MKRYVLFVMLALLLALNGCAGERKETENFQFTYQDCVITIGEEAASFLDALGEPKSYTEEPSCAFEGMDKTYGYGSFYMTTYPKDGVDRIARIWFADDSVQTQEGIYIGAAKDAVEKAYGDVFAGQNSCTLIQGNSKLTIILEGDKVRSIVYEVG